MRGTLLRDEVRELTGGEGGDHVDPYRPLIALGEMRNTGGGGGER